MVIKYQVISGMTIMIPQFGSQLINVSVCFFCFFFVFIPKQLNLLFQINLKMTLKIIGQDQIQLINDE